MPVTVLVLYHSRHGSVAALAEKIAIGVEAAGGTALLRTVPALHISAAEGAALQANSAANTAPARHPVVSAEELAQADALAIGSPVRFGLMSAEMKAFWDSTSAFWLKGTLIDKAAGVFTSSSSMHGGNEATLLGMMLPLLHHGMVLLGTPYDQPALHQTQSGGTPYGPSHVTGPEHSSGLTPHEQQLAVQFGKRLALVAGKLQ